MFDIAPSEMMVVALVAIVFIGPKDLPRVMRVVGQWVGKGRTLARHFRTAMDDMVREAEIAEMEQKWKAENERIMREHAHLLDAPPVAPDTTLMPYDANASAPPAHDAIPSVPPSRDAIPTAPPARDAVPPAPPAYEAAPPARDPTQAGTPSAPDAPARD